MFGFCFCRLRYYLFMSGENNSQFPETKDFVFSNTKTLKLKNYLRYKGDVFYDCSIHIELQTMYINSEVIKIIAIKKLKINKFQ